MASSGYREGSPIGDVEDEGAFRTPPQHPVARLVPGSGVQFVDIALSTGPLAMTFSRFIEETDRDEGAVLIPLSERPDYDGLEWHPVTSQALKPSETLWLTGFGGLEPFVGKWVPLPYLRVVGRNNSGAPEFDVGPANWARLFIEAPSVGLRQAETLKAVIAFDTGLETGGRLDQAHYLAPNHDDVRHGAEFRLASDPAALSPLLAEVWLDDWLAGLFGMFREAASSDGRAVGAGGDAFQLEHIARYLTLLKVLERTARLPLVRFTDIFGHTLRTVTTGVDLAIDIGDDRTAAILLGRDGPTDAQAFAEAATLKVRDLSRPTVVHTGPCRTLGEFDRPNFGDMAASRRSGRPDAFFWPSLLRVGEEATRLSLRPSAVPGLTGLDGLRAALSDTSGREAMWRFSRDEGLGEEPGGVVSGELLAHLTEDGSSMQQAGAAALPALRPKFSRSAILSMYLAEIILHALSQINAPDRSGRDVEIRRLQRVMVSCPAAASEDERTLLRQRVEGSLDLIWSSFRWNGRGGVATPSRPEVVLGLDAGLSAQLLYLFDEVQGRFGGNARQFVGLTRGTDTTTASIGSLTVGSLDLSGGATGLAIVDYDLGREGGVHPQIVLADRSTIAGRSLIDLMVTSVIVPSLAEGLTAGGHTDAWGLIETLITGRARDTGHELGDRYLGGRLQHKILRPAAQAFLELYQGLPGGEVARGLRRFTFAGLVQRGKGRLDPLDQQIEAMAAVDGARDFRLGAATVSLRPIEVARLLADYLDPLVERVAEVVRHYGCDVLLLTGPFAGLMDFQRLVVRRLPLAPHRVINLNERRFGLVDQIGGPGVAADAGHLRLLPLVGASLAARNSLETSGLALLTDGLEPPAGVIGAAGLGALKARKSVPYALRREGAPGRRDKAGAAWDEDHSAVVGVVQEEA